jgi:hypothetical protein
MAFWLRLRRWGIGQDWPTGSQRGSRFESLMWHPSCTVDPRSGQAPRVLNPPRRTRVIVPCVDQDSTHPCLADEYRIGSSLGGWRRCPALPLGPSARGRPGSCCRGAERHRRDPLAGRQAAPAWPPSWPRCTGTTRRPRPDAASLMAMAPVLIMFIVPQRHIIDGRRRPARRAEHVEGSARRIARPIHPYWASTRFRARTYHRRPGDLRRWERQWSGRRWTRGWP